MNEMSTSNSAIYCGKMMNGYRIKQQYKVIFIVQLFSWADEKVGINGLESNSTMSVLDCNLETANVTHVYS